MKQFNLQFLILPLTIIFQLKCSWCQSTSQWSNDDDDIQNIPETNTTFDITKLYDELNYLLNTDNINNITQFNQSQSRSRRLIYPGNTWCGIGKVAANTHRPRMFYRTDSCCRAHYSCPSKRNKWTQHVESTEAFLEEDPMTTMTTELVETTMILTTREPVSPPTRFPYRMYQPQRTQSPHTSENYRVLNPNQPPIGYKPPGESKYNWEMSRRQGDSTLLSRQPRWNFQLPNCECDLAFYYCLRYANNKISRHIGKIYFNYIHRRCVKFDHPATRCLTRQGIFAWRCVEYEVDSTKPMDYQLRDNPYFYYLF